MDPGQYKKPCVVRDEANILPPYFRRPSDKPVPAAEVTGRRGPRHAGDGPLLAIDNVFEVLAHWLSVAQIMVLLDQAVEETLLSGVSHLVEVKGLDLRKPPFQGALIQIRTAKRDLALGQGIERGKPFRGQLDMAAPVQHKHHPATNHVPQRTVGLHPVPLPAEDFGEAAAAGTGMVGDEFLDKRYVCVRYPPASVLDFHARRIAKGDLDRKLIMKFFSPPLCASNTVLHLLFGDCHSRAKAATGRHPTALSPLGLAGATTEIFPGKAAYRPSKILGRHRVRSLGLWRACFEKQTPLR